MLKRLQIVRDNKGRHLQLLLKLVLLKMYLRIVVVVLPLIERKLVRNRLKEGLQGALSLFSLSLARHSFFFLSLPLIVFGSL